MVDAESAARLFDPTWYRETYSGVEGYPPYEHFQRIGMASGFDPNPMFSTRWYLQRYPEVAKSGLTVLEDYVTRGVELGRDPGPLFVTRWYLTRYPDVAESRLNPLYHYLEWGCKEGRDPSPLFDTGWYFSRYPDAASAGQDARKHYMCAGAALGFAPCAAFDTKWYCEVYPEVVAAGVNPLVHYVVEGAAQGFDPNPNFSTARYVERHPELLKSGVNPLIHYLSHHLTQGFGSSGKGRYSRPSSAAIAEVQALIEAFAPTEADMAALPEALESLPVAAIAPGPAETAWRGLYLSLNVLPNRLVLVGSIDRTPELTRIAGGGGDLLVVETDSQEVSTAELLPRGTPWRSLAEFSTGLDEVGRSRVVTALIHGLQPSVILVWGSRAGWDMVAQHGATLCRASAFLAVADALPELPADELIQRYFRRCIPSLSRVYASDIGSLQRRAAAFGLPAKAQSKLMPLSALLAAGTLGAPGKEIG